MARHGARPDAERLITEVAREVGLDDYGHPSFREGLERLLASATSQAALTPVGMAVLEGTCRGGLANRLRVTDWQRRHPEVSEQRIVAPLFVVGLPRTGTTALSHLLGCDPANRSLLGWEANASVPPPTTAGYRTDPRFERARDATRAMDGVSATRSAWISIRPMASSGSPTIRSMAWATIFRRVS